MFSFDVEKKFFPFSPVVIWIGDPLEKGISCIVKCNTQMDVSILAHFQQVSLLCRTMTVQESN